MPVTIFDHYDSFSEEKNKGLTSSEKDFEKWLALKKDSGELALDGVVVKKTADDGGQGLFASKDISAGAELVRISESMVRRFDILLRCPIVDTEGRDEVMDANLAASVSTSTVSYQSKSCSGNGSNLHLHLNGRAGTAIDLQDQFCNLRFTRSPPIAFLQVQSNLD